MIKFWNAKKLERMRTVKRYADRMSVYFGLLGPVCKKQEYVW